MLRPVRLILCLVLAMVLAPPSVAQDRAAAEAGFRVWLEEVVWPRAAAAGVGRGTFERALADLRPDWNLPDLVMPGAPAPPPRIDRQTEFGVPARYFRPGALEGAAAAGRRMARDHAGALARATERTGVPGRIVLAIWSRESAFGRAALPHDAFRVLATKGYMSTRAAYFTDELIAALRIVEAGRAQEGGLRSSWAGALGQPQFMPSSFLRHATDGDGDGRADIWRSEADTIASIATYLVRHGWVAGRDWGFEVTVPASVSCAQEGPDQGRTIADWVASGVARVSGRPFPAHELPGTGFLMMPAGRNGPAFLVTPNFYVLKDYNMSDLYALYVGHLGDRIRYGVGPFRAGWDDVSGLTRSEVARMQAALIALGHDTGGADGLAGFRTRRAIGRWQEATGRAPTCFPDADIIRALVP